MRRRIFWLLTFIACAFVAWSLQRTGVHDFAADQCGDCHAVAPVKGDPRSREMKAPVSVLCGGCHQRPENAISHPVEIAPDRAALPADFPLSWDGKLTCSTCHNIHAGEGLRSSLRRSGGRAFCEACHRRGVVERGSPYGHSQVLTSAHMEFDDKQAGRVDTISAMCLGCHDGTIGKDTPVRVGSFRHGVRPEESAQELSHPIGVNYRRAMTRRGGLHPPEGIDERIRLVNGKVGCVSCHDMYSRERKLLTVSNDRAGLCLACHDK